MKQIARTKIVTNGRISVPTAVREALDLSEGDTILFEESEFGVIIKKGLIVEAPRKPQAASA
jgi:AbrB family looped-hinge helix DNA binding protein